jgi:hypothetical protein
MTYLGAQNSIALGVQGLIHIDTGGGAGGSADYLLAKSLRFRSSASAYLNRTFGTPTNNKKWTWSGWVKRGSPSTVNYLFSACDTPGGSVLAELYTTDTIYFYVTLGGSTTFNVGTTAVFRDFAAWYHIIFVFDSAQATLALGCQLYVNGVAQTLSGTYTQNGASILNSSGAITEIGRRAYTSISYFDGELAEVNFVDGQALLPASFGATGGNSQWLPKAYAGTYGTNGFYLPFTTTTSTTTLVADSSGNGNNWTPNNISLTAGSTYDSLTDVPTLTSATVANYAVLNPLQNGAGTLSGGNLNLLGASAAWGTRLGTIAVTSGKWYFEVTPTSGSATSGIQFGITQNAAPAGVLGQDANGYSYYGFNGQKYNNNSGVAYGATVADNDVVGVAFDVTAGTITFYKNNVSQGVAFSGLAAGTWFLGVSCYNTATASINFGQRPFTYTPPTGYLALNTYNIPAGTVTTSGTFTGNLSTDGPMVYLNGTPTAMTINGNAVTFGTQADKLANGFKVRSSSASYNASGSNTYTASTVGAVFKYEDAQANP